MEACPLSVWTRGEEVLEESPDAVAGHVFHRARELALERADEQTSSADSALERALAESAASRGLDGAGLSSTLIGALGRCRWIDLVADLRRWHAAVDGLPRPHSSPVRRGRGTHDSSAAVPDRFETGLEQTWTCNDLRLRGRPDESRLNGLVVEVCDLKTGARARSAGASRDAAETQVRLYLLMAERLTSIGARGYIVGRGVEEVPWGPEERASTSMRVRAFGERFPALASVEGRSAAQPGSHCLRCRVRPKCPAYLSVAPSWWPNTDGVPRPLPLDVWGTITKLESSQERATVWLRDAGGRVAVVRNIAATYGLQSLVAGEEVYFFGLAADQDQNLHGRRVHPTAFSEFATGSRRTRASALRVFRRAGT